MCLPLAFRAPRRASSTQHASSWMPREGWLAAVAVLSHIRRTRISRVRLHASQGLQHGVWSAPAIAYQRGRRRGPRTCNLAMGRHHRSAAIPYRRRAARCRCGRQPGRPSPRSRGVAICPARSHGACRSGAEVATTPASGVHGRRVRNLFRHRNAVAKSACSTSRIGRYGAALVVSNRLPASITAAASPATSPGTSG